MATKRHKKHPSCDSSVPIAYKRCADSTGGKNPFVFFVANPVLCLPSTVL